ncbi:glutamyl-tRNA reductase [Microbacterium sp.]|uniref:glutamyl-tRNA reductase n=1 Tax=Microbacterium sp. TaxID=51671 RepID=UPI003A920F3E
MLYCFTSSHRTAGFDTLGLFERGADRVIERLAAQGGAVAGHVVLSTCNRFEAYVDVTGVYAANDISSPDADGVARVHTIVVDALADASGLSASDVRASGETLRGDDVAAHAFAVASGLESVVVGEGEIAGQVRRALESARARGTASRELERVFQLASRTSRGVKNRTALSQAGRSVVRLALDMAESRVSDWAATRVLLVGTGRYAGASLAALRDRGVRDVRVYSRTGRAAGFAASHGITPADDLIEALAASGLVVACSTVQQVVVEASTVVAARALPGAAPRRLIIDLGLPRNVAPDVATVPETELIDLELLRTHAPLPEFQAAADARALVDEALADYRRATAEDAVTPALVALRSHVFDVLDDEIARARSRGDDSSQTEAALRHLAGVLLHTPSVRARELAADGRADEFVAGLEAMFGVRAAAACPVVGLRPDAGGAHRADAAS